MIACIFILMYKLFFWFITSFTSLFAVHSTNTYHDKCLCISSDKLFSKKLYRRTYENKLKKNLSLSCFQKFSKNNHTKLMSVDKLK
jgi:hypothetical protein